MGACSRKGNVSGFTEDACRLVQGWMVQIIKITRKSNRAGGSYIDIVSKGEDGLFHILFLNQIEHAMFGGDDRISGCIS